MRKLLLFMGVLILILPQTVFGNSYGYAPGYGAASHTDEYPLEWFGAQDGVEDGITFSNFCPGAFSALEIAVTLDPTWFDPTNASDGDYEYLSIWIDWDRDFVFDDLEEVFNSYQFFNGGTTTLFENIYVPEYATYGQTWMRARMTFEGPLTPGGEYFTGEVEDYAADVVPEPATLTLLGVGLLTAGIFRKKARRNH